MLSVKNLQAGYGGVPVVHNVSFEVKEGALVGLLGSNGSGKTTSLRAITGLIKPMNGEITFQGNPLRDKSAHKMIAMGISMVPENRHLFGKMSVQDNLLMGGYLIKDKIKLRERLEKVYDMFPRVKERLKQKAETLSGGEQQMVAIARGLMADPKLLILDEPSLGLGPKIVAEVFEFVREIKGLGVTVILVEQNVNQTLDLADYVYVIQNGEIALSGPAEDMKENAEVKKAYLGL